MHLAFSFRISEIPLAVVVVHGCKAVWRKLQKLYVPKPGSCSSRESPTVHVAGMSVVSGVLMVKTQEWIAVSPTSVTKTVITRILVCLLSQLRITS